MAITIAILGLLTALVPLAIYFYNRKTAATPEQRRDDNAADYAAKAAELAALEDAGDFAGADALRKRLFDDVTAERSPGGSAGEQLPPQPASGDGDSVTK